MTGRTAIVFLGATLLAADAPGQSRPARPVAIRWTAGVGDAARVEVVGLPPETLAALRAADWRPVRWSGLLAVTVASAGEPAPAIAGRYAVVNDVLRFEPRFPFEPGLRYRARLHGAALPGPPEADHRDVTAEFAMPAAARGEPARVVKVDPAADRLPENLLKFYIHFSRPMSRGKAYDHVHLLDASGRALDMPFLELGDELWDPSGTRLTLLLDPGRLKQGLRPREEEGPILVAGRRYTLAVDPAWPDAAGFPLAEGFRKTFRTGPLDDAQPDPSTWTVAAPAAGSTDPLTVVFPEPLDRAMLDRAIVLHGPDGAAVPGRREVNAAGTRWALRPGRAWTPGTYRLVIDAELEDLAGNSIARPFEVDADGPVTRRTQTASVSVPVAIRNAP